MSEQKYCKNCKHKSMGYCMLAVSKTPNDPVTGKYVYGKTSLCENQRATWADKGSCMVTGDFWEPNWLTKMFSRDQ